MGKKRTINDSGFLRRWGEGWSEGVDKGSDAGRVSLLDKLKYFPPSGFGFCSEVGIEVIAENQRVRG